MCSPYRAKEKNELWVKEENPLKMLDQCINNRNKRRKKTTLVAVCILIYGFLNCIWLHHDTSVNLNTTQSRLWILPAGPEYIRRSGPNWRVTLFQPLHTGMNGLTALIRSSMWLLNIWPSHVHLISLNNGCVITENSNVECGSCYFQRLQVHWIFFFTNTKEIIFPVCTYFYFYWKSNEHVVSNPGM